jgi:hypothetical protein
MKRTYLLALALILSAHTAFAAPITTGSWHSITATNNDGDPFFDNLSWDCASCNIGNFMTETEWLDPVAWSITSTPLVSVFGISSYFDQHTFGYDNGALWLNNGHGYTARSTVAGQVALFRRVGTNATAYWAAFEDLPDTGATDRDFNDRVLYWAETNPEQDPRGVPFNTPEPAALILFGIAALGVRLHRRKA